jgi:hypothetical protein
MKFITSNDRFTEKGLLFAVAVKGHIDLKHINKHINFPPIWRKTNYITNENTIGKFMFNKMKR